MKSLKLNSKIKIKLTDIPYHQDDNFKKWLKTIYK